jgi:hypothetical protein
VPGCRKAHRLQRMDAAERDADIHDLKHWRSSSGR